jgi:Fic family protein
MQQNKKQRGRPSRQSISQHLSEAIHQLHSAFGGLPHPDEAEAVWGKIWVHDAHNSPAIEGNTLVLREVEALLATGRALGNLELREYLEVAGYANAARWVYSQALGYGHESDGRLITMTEVRRIHSLVLSGVWDVAPHPNATDAERPGSFRQHEIAQFPGGMRPPSWVEVPAAMSEWVATSARIAKADNVMEALAVAHAEFERIHPFLDGNGRTGRLIVNLILVRMGYPPLIIYKRQRSKYLVALRLADEGAPGALAELFARAVTDSVYRFIIPTNAGMDALVPLAALASSEVSVESMKAAIARGRLKAQKGSDGKWRSSRTWLNEYHASKHERNEPMAGFDES